MSRLLKYQNDCFLEITGEITEGKGEDCCLADFSESGVVFAVFDGCGGIGSEQYGGPFQNHTGAYLASRTAASAFRKWFSCEFAPGSVRLTPDNLPPVCQEVRGFLRAELDEAGKLVRSSDGQEGLRIKGSMYKLLPTTASMVVGQYQDNQVNLYYLWAGDSRGYLLNKRGMMQITLDDTSRGLDAWDSLFEDQTLTNMLSADSDFHLHACHLLSDLPLLAIAATDGCFDYLPTPMDFEHLILGSLMNSGNYDEWLRAVDAGLKETAGDDYAMEIGVFGFSDFQDVKDYFRERELSLGSTLKLLSLFDEEQSREEWNYYKQLYYRDVP